MTRRSSEPESPSIEDDRRVVWRAVLPVEDVAELLPLYLDGERSRSGLTVLGRHTLALDAGRSVSFGSYFNAFPASYWQTNTTVTSVRLEVRGGSRASSPNTRVDAVVRVIRSDADGRQAVVAESPIDDRKPRVFDLPLTGFGDGGMYWFDVDAGDDSFEFYGAEWSIRPARPAGSATVGMATFNRPAYCLDQLRTLAAEPALLASIDRIVVVDQGSATVATQDGFAQVAEALGERLVLIRQTNLGGSGGFSRAMLEALERAESDYVLLLDDDAVSEPEAIARAIHFADAATSATIVGGGMLHLDARPVLYAQSEQWNRRLGWVDLARPGAYDHDFSRVPQRDEPFLHRRHRSDFNGWWMCLIPLSVVRKSGLPLPLFLKGDDVEFGLRAAEHAVVTVSLPGVALWHMGWGGKAPTRTWEAYFLHRNRLIAELLHSPRRRPTAMIAHSFLGDMKPLLKLQYGAVALRAQAIEDVFAGPERLPGWLATRAGQVRALWGSYADAQPVDAGGLPVGSGRTGHAPDGRMAGAALLARVWLRHLARRESPGSLRRPDARVGATELDWSTFSGIDSALVDTADGTATVWYRRSRSATRQALGRSIRLHARLWWRWPRLARTLRVVAPDLTSPASWARIFEAGG